jgi:O-antigen ligase
VQDTNTSLRLALYEAGVRAFLEAPVFGHGWARLTTSVAPYLNANASLTPELREFALNLPQLHNDVINMAVAAGLVGIAVYALLIATPLVAAWRSSRDELYAFRLFGAAILCIAYVFDGLTDLMFGFEFHTMLYVALTAILLGYCREPGSAPA